MDADKLNYYKKILIKEREQLLDELKRFEDEESQGLKDATGELSSYDNHPGDQGSNTFEREKDSGLKDNTLGLLEKIDNALELIENNNYGSCQQCGKKIVEDRLEAIPYTSLCKDCSSNEVIFDKVKGDRPIEEDVIGDPFSDSFTDKTDNNAYDGEDTWQDVAQYGTSNTNQDVSEIDGQEVDKNAYIDADEPQGTVEEVEKISNEEKNEGAT